MCDVNPYFDKLVKLQCEDVHELKQIKDQWCTPDPVYFGIEKLVTGVHRSIVLDLFTDGQNSKADNYYTVNDNALTQPWRDDLRALGDCNKVWAFANPPYSHPFEWNGEACTGMSNIMAKAFAERNLGAGIIMLVKNAHSDSWWPDALSEFPADAIISIKGRLTYDLPVWAKTRTKKTAAGFGASIIVFKRGFTSTVGNVVSREEIYKIGTPHAVKNRAQRQAWIESFEEL